MGSLDQDGFASAIHQHTDLREYLDAVFGQQQIGPLNFFKLAAECIDTTGTIVAPFKAFRRLERLSVLLRFMLHALKNTKGPVAECGVLLGFSTLAMSRVMSALKENGAPDSMRDIWLIDSYEGLSEPSKEDWVTQKVKGREITAPPMQKGHFATPLEHVQKNLAGMTNGKFAKGWIPDVFSTLPDTKWSFVHVDVDLYEPVKNCLEYFYPRLEKGAIIINDDFGSALFPGAGQAWREFFAAQKKGYAILDTGQAVFINR